MIKTKESTYHCPICEVRRGFPIVHHIKSNVGKYHHEILTGLKKPTCPKCKIEMEFERWKIFPFCDKCNELLKLDKKTIK